MGSRRFPGKVLREICGKPMLWHVVQRVRQVRMIEKVVVATSTLAIDSPIQNFCDREEIACFRGSEQDVLDRFYRAAQENRADPVIRLTGDCPFADPQVISKLLVLFSGGQYDHVGVATGAGALFLEGGHYPDGLDCECFTWKALETAWNEAKLTSDREHVTPFIWRNPERFRVGSLQAINNYSQYRWVVDNEADFALVSQVYEALYPQNEFFLMQDILEFLARNPAVGDLNQSFVGDEGYEAFWFPNRSRSNLETE
jgi:spore coat polysaccharide biosynthesis protein SpsF